LLGLYLGDGHLILGRKGVWLLSITCCDDWPGLMAQARLAMSAVMPSSKVFARAKTGCTDIKSTSKHWLCLFPQHGPGRKHQRVIELNPGRSGSWQSIRVTSRAAFFTPMDIAGPTGSGGCSKMVTGGMSIRVICS
jgi:hypothetical protein